MQALIHMSRFHNNIFYKAYFYRRSTRTENRKQAIRPQKGSRTTKAAADAFISAVAPVLLPKLGALYSVSSQALSMAFGSSCLYTLEMLSRFQNISSTKLQYRSGICGSKSTKFKCFKIFRAVRREKTKHARLAVNLALFTA